MKKFLFIAVSLGIAFAIGWKFGQNWMPDFFYNYLHTSQSMDRVLLIGEWVGALIAVIINAVYIFFAIDKYRIRDLILGIVILVIVGIVLAVAAKILMKAFYIVVVIGLIAGWVLFSILDR